jgi:large subunit ribosomal protein L19
VNRDIINKIEAKYLKADRPQLRVGYTVIVNTIIRDGEKKRFQKFEGIVIAINGTGMAKTFTVRKISYGIGVEKIFPVHSANIESIKIVKQGKVRRSKLYYLRDRVGKAAMKLKGDIYVTSSGADESNVDEVVAVERSEEVSTEDAVAEETAA